MNIIIIDKNDLIKSSLIKYNMLIIKLNKISDVLLLKFFKHKHYYS